MTYGPEPGTTVLKQRFGPINRKQGHRRLNVLFSRARTRIGLFSSFGSSDIKPTPDSAEGVHVSGNIWSMQRRKAGWPPNQVA